MSFHDRLKSVSKSASKPLRRVAKDWATAPLTARQKTTLAIAAKAAWVIQQEAGLAVDDFDVWRHAQVFIACGRAGLREATNQHFRSIEAHFARLCGNEKKAQSIWQKTGRVQGSTEAHDTHENREVARAILRDLVAASNGLISEGYVGAISRSKFSDRTQYELTALELQDLVVTVRSRLSKKLRPQE